MTQATDTRRSALDAVLERVGSAEWRLPGDLFAAVEALESSVALRRALTDPGAGENRRRGLVRAVFAGKVCDAAVTVLEEAAALRWSSGRDLVVALEQQAVTAQLIRAEADGNLDETEDELFRFARTVESDSRLRSTIGDRGLALSARQELVRGLLEGRVTPATLALAQRAVAARDRSFAHTIEGFVNLAAAHQRRVVATVRVARPLEGEQRERLRAALARQVGRDVAIQEVVEPELLGGIRVELGDEVLEGTVAGRLESARRLFG